MKFAIKLVSAAVALAISGSALATAGDIFVDVYDPKTTESFVFDTGVALQQTPTTGILTTVNLSSYADWGTFSSAVLAAGGSLSNLEYIATAATGTARAGFFNQSYSTLSNGLTFPTVLAKAQSLSGFTGTGALGDSIQAAGAFAGFVGLTGDYGNNLGIGGNGIATVGTSMGIYEGTQSGAVSQQVTSIDVTTTQLVIGTATSPTPEPGTYGLMVAGLLAVGAIVRRRSRA